MNAIVDLQVKIDIQDLDLDALSKSHYRQLRNFIKKHAISNDHIDDLLQQTYLEAIENKHSFRGNSKPETWLFGIAYNLVRNANRKQYRRPHFEELDEHQHPLPTRQTCPGQINETQRALDSVGSAFEKLSTDMQQLISLACAQDKTYAEMAVVFNVPVGTIRSRLSRVRTQLKTSTAA